MRYVLISKLTALHGSEKVRPVNHSSKPIHGISRCQPLGKQHTTRKREQMQTSSKLDDAGRDPRTASVATIAFHFVSWGLPTTLSLRIFASAIMTLFVT